MYRIRSESKQYSGKVIVLNKKDNVATALGDIKKGSCLGQSLVAKRDISAGFKISLTMIPKGAKIYKYGQIIGVAKNKIEPGEKVHIENLSSLVK